MGFSPALDVTYVVDALHEGRTHRPLETVRHLGGKAVNLARVAAALGASVRVVVPLSAEDAAIHRAFLAEEGVELVAVRSDAPLRMCVSVASRSSGLMTEVYESPVLLSADVVEPLLRAAGRSDRLAFSGSVPLGTEGAVAQLVGSNRHAAVDTHGASLAAAVSAGPELVKVNRSEAESFLGAVPGGPLLDLVQDLRLRSGGTAVVTDSTAGIAAAGAHERWLARLPGVVGGFSQGSGDAMMGGMLAAYDTGGDLVDAIRLGVAAATANALVPGGGRLDPSVARDLVARVELTRG